MPAGAVVAHVVSIEYVFDRCKSPELGPASAGTPPNGAPTDSPPVGRGSFQGLRSFSRRRPHTRPARARGGTRGVAPTGYARPYADGPEEGRSAAATIAARRSSAIR